MVSRSVAAAVLLAVVTVSCTSVAARVQSTPESQDGARVVLPAGWPAARSVWPGPSNTGVPAGVVLHAPVTNDPNYSVAGNSVIVSRPGVTVSGLDIQGELVIEANNVTIDGVRVVDAVDAIPVLVDYTSVTGPVTIENSDLSGGSGPNCAAVVGYTHMRLLYDNIHDCAHGVQPNGDDVVQDSWIHTLDSAADAHHDGMQITEGSNIFIVHNFVEDQQNEVACLQVGADQGPISNVVEEDNLLNGGGYSIYGGALDGYPGYAVTNIKILNNRIMRLPEPGAYFANGGSGGPVTAIDDPQITYQGNVWDDTSTPAT